MPPKVYKASSKPTQTKTVAKASTSSSSKSSRSSKSSSSSSVIKTTSTSNSRPTPNVDKVDFGKTKTTASAGVYHRPKPIAAATGRDPETKTKPTPSAAHKEKIDERAHKQIEAEKKARSEEAPKKIHKTMAKAPLVLAASAVGGKWAGAAANAILDWADVNEAKAHDQGKMSSTEQIIYEENLYEHSHFAAPCGSGLTAQGIMDKEYDKAHQAEIDQRKAEIRAEEEENEKK